MSKRPGFQIEAGKRLKLEEPENVEELEPNENPELQAKASVANGSELEGKEVFNKEPALFGSPKREYLPLPTNGPPNNSELRPHSVDRN